jgi:AraC-like DNA-binding protein
VNEIVEKEKQKRSYLSNIDKEKLRNKIDELMKTEEIFIDDNLTMDKLASLSEVSYHQLSEFINSYYGKNFITFINEFRIKKAKKLLNEKPEYTILAIAYEAGFNSKSAFNAAFLKITGFTPSEYKSTSGK